MANKVVLVIAIILQVILIKFLCATINEILTEIDRNIAEVILVTHFLEALAECISASKHEASLVSFDCVVKFPANQ